MGCPKTTPAGSPHEIHDGLQVGDGVFVQADGRLCVHTTPDGSDPAVQVRQLHPGVSITQAEATLVGEPEPADPSLKAGRRRKRDE